MILVTIAYAVEGKEVTRTFLIRGTSTETDGEQLEDLREEFDVRFAERISVSSLEEIRNEIGMAELGV